MTTVTVQRNGEDVTVGKRLYVGNLSWKTRWQGLKDVFKTEGDVVHADVKMYRDGRSAGHGIVEYATPREAADAMVKLNDYELDGRKIFVREDREDRDLGGEGKRAGRGGKGAGGRGGGRGGRGAAANGDVHRVVVSNLDAETSWQDLKDHFRKIGHVARADVAAKGDGKEGTVDFSSAEDAERAVSELNETSFKGATISVASP